MSDRVRLHEDKIRVYVDEPLPVAGSVDVGGTVMVTNSVANAAPIGRAFLVGSGRLTLSVSGNVRGIIQNPAGSGVNTVLAGLAIFGTSTSWASLYLNPTAGIPVTANRVGMNAAAGGGHPRQTILRVDTNATTALSGGLDTGIVIGTGAGSRESLDMPFSLILAPGVTLGINVPFAGAADATMTAYLTETPL